MSADTNHRSYKGRFPFRIGCTSYVFPDEILPNVRAMAPLVDDIELVLFESADHANLPSSADVEELHRVAKRHELTYTVHFPLDRRAGAVERAESNAFLEQCRRIVSLMEPAEPYAYVLHLEGLEDGTDSEIRRWRDSVERVCESIGNVVNGAPRKVCVENLGYDWRLHRSIVERAGFSYCLDIGHMWLYENGWLDACREILPRARVVHLHGLEQGRDHVSLACGPHESIMRVVSLLRSGYDRVVTLEVFRERDTFESLAYLEELWRTLRC